MLETRPLVILLLGASLFHGLITATKACSIAFGKDVINIRLTEPSPTDLSFEALLYYSNVTYGDVINDNGDFIGNCIPLKDCPTWVKLTRTKPLNYVRYLRNVYCGQDRRTSLYCCPRLEASGRDRDSETTVTVTTEVPDSNMFTVGDWKINLQQHPNRKLLPGTRIGDCGRDKNNKIINGINAELGQYPWNVRIGYQDVSRPQNPVDFLCGGTVINNRYVLTAAHCFASRNYKLTTVRFGEHDVRQDPDCSVENSRRVCADPVIDISVNESNVFSHPGFNVTNNRNDIALIRLPKPLNFSDWIQPICLPLREVLRKPKDQVRVTVTGWGRINAFAGTNADVLQQIPLPLYDVGECHKFFTAFRARQYPISSQDQICLGNGTGDSCKGDSGGPAMVVGDLSQNPKFYLVGIVSFGPSQCNSPGVYTFVPSYTKWILDHLQS